MSCTASDVQAGVSCTLSCPDPQQVPTPYAKRTDTCNGASFPNGPWPTTCRHPPVAVTIGAASASAVSVSDPTGLDTVAFGVTNALGSPVTTSGTIEVSVLNVTFPAASISSGESCTMSSASSCTLAAPVFSSFGYYVLAVAYTQTSPDFDTYPPTAALATPATSPAITVRVELALLVSSITTGENIAFASIVHGAPSSASISLDASLSTCEFATPPPVQVEANAVNTLFTYTAGVDFESMTGPNPCVLVWTSDDDPSFSTPPFTLTVTDVDEPALLSMSQTLATLTEPGNVTVTITVADVDTGADPVLILGSQPNGVRVFHAPGSDPSALVLVDTTPFVFPAPVVRRSPSTSSSLLCPAPTPRRSTLPTTTYPGSEPRSRPLRSTFRVLTRSTWSSVRRACVSAPTRASSLTCRTCARPARRGRTTIQPAAPFHVCRASRACTAPVAPPNPRLMTAGGSFRRASSPRARQPTSAAVATSAHVATSAFGVRIAFLASSKSRACASHAQTLARCLLSCSLPSCSSS
ncbi:uncharacterized protein AMSG_12107 [Thecamonas trahens ATCC 50062]|uniref:Uncharacterized protein n=1 Tax=Thecamonas trahens ATCC 50062 TaxID=461836 RepID=A0A0L0DK98_THETB|nr:hypothetical protein AMSG_12107 [Thecamonas trahens ATCC 50062]KNC51793.1 hypothetical protein AMSG_12107 [Thecamonas trahens ATCC 50062]|eukprot:XP_013755765.1 hypothetical protein AMSG_12107 [Thecamonas trahens ATCC 50062]